MEKNEITPRFKRSEWVIAKKYWLSGTVEYQWRRITKVDIRCLIGEPYVVYSFLADWRDHKEGDVFASEEELFEKTGRKINETFCEIRPNEEERKKIARAIADAASIFEYGTVYFPVGAITAVWAYHVRKNGHVEPDTGAYVYHDVDCEIEEIYDRNGYEVECDEEKVKDIENEVREMIIKLNELNML